MGGFWELCWKMLAPRLCFFRDLGRCCGIFVPRWRTGAPRRGKVGELTRRGLLLGGSNPRGPSGRAPLHPPKNGFSRMGLQTPTPSGTGSGKLEDWRTGYWAFGFTLYTQLCLAARWRIHYILYECRKTTSVPRLSNNSSDSTDIK